MPAVPIMTPAKWALSAVFILLLWGLFPVLPGKLLGMWSQDDFNYGYFVLPVSLFLIWEEREHLKTTPLASTWGFLIPLTVGIGFYLLGELGGEYTMLFVSAWCLVVALCWLLLGRRKLRVIVFPMVFLLAMFPPPAFIQGNLTLKLKLISTQIGVALLHLLGVSAYREGNVIDLGFTQLQVVDACSGLRYVFPLLVLGILLAYYLRAPLWRRLLLIGATVPLSILTNSVRIAVIGLLYPSMGKMTTEGPFHDFTGWLIFVFSLLVLLLLMRLLRKPVGNQAEIPSSKEIETPPPPVSARTLALQKLHLIVAVLVLGGLLLAMRNVEFREKIPIKQPLAGFPLVIDEWQGVRVPMEQQFIDALDFSDYAIIDYRDPAGRVINFYVAYYASQRKGESIHSPSSCLPGGGWVFSESGLLSIDPGPYARQPIKVNRAFIEKGAVRQLTYYWFPQRGRRLTNMLEMKFFAFWDALTRQRTDGALIRLITPVGRDESVERADQRLQEMTRKLLPLLDQYLPGKDA